MSKKKKTEKRTASIINGDWWRLEKSQTNRKKVP